MSIMTTLLMNITLIKKISKKLLKDKNGTHSNLKHRKKLTQLIRTKKTQKLITFLLILMKK